MNLLQEKIRLYFAQKLENIKKAAFKSIDEQTYNDMAKLQTTTHIDGGRLFEAIVVEGKSLPGYEGTLSIIAHDKQQNKYFVAWVDFINMLCYAKTL